MTGQFRSYVICTTPRSGSTMLCEMLAATGIAGHPKSAFHTPALTSWLKAHGLDRRTYSSPVEAIRAVFTAAQKATHGAKKARTGPFGFRLQRDSFPYFVESLRLAYPGAKSDLAALEAAFGKTLFIHLEREDALGQAISRLRAERTGLWHRHSDGRDMERLAPERPLEDRHHDGYDKDLIETYIALAKRQNEAWSRWFEREGISALKLSYGALAASPHAVLVQVLSCLGLDPARAARIEVQTAKLADARSQDWRLRFLSQTGTAME